MDLGHLPDIGIVAFSIGIGATLLVLLIVARRRRARASMPQQMVDVRQSLLPTEDVPRSRADIEANIGSAVATGDKQALAPLYLELAQWHGRKGDQDARLTALRSAAGYGALHNAHAAHAAARLELAEAAHKAGDLTGACEQWQLARTAFLESGQKAEHERIDKLMRDNGCPTDWVLTDF